LTATYEYHKQYHGTLLEGFDNPDELLSYLAKQGLLALATTQQDFFV